MTIEEFSNEFDSILQSYNTKEEFGNLSAIAFDEYEKSVFLTKAQEEIVLELYKNSFEGNEFSRRILFDLVKTFTKSSPSLSTSDTISNKSYIVSGLPSDLWFITYELATLSDSNNTCINNKTVSVQPIKLDDLFRVMLNPFRLSNSRRVLRVDSNLSSKSLELISDYTISKYIMRYISKPTPIILVNLQNTDLSINGIKNASTCLLNESIHKTILERAVLLAKQSILKS